MDGPDRELRLGLKDLGRLFGRSKPKRSPEPIKARANAKPGTNDGRGKTAQKGMEKSGKAMSVSSGLRNGVAIGAATRPKKKVPSPAASQGTTSPIQLTRRSLDEFDKVTATYALEPPGAPSSSDRSEVWERLSHLGAILSSSDRVGLAPLDLVIGVDVGSTSTKVAIRFPYHATRIAQPVPAPNWLRADDHPYYWRTLMWEAGDGRCLLLPEAGATKCDRIKVEYLSAVSRGEAAGPAAQRMTAWIALMIRQSLGWLHAEQPRLCASHAFRHCVNVGFPSAGLENDASEAAFRRCCQAAGLLAQSNLPISSDLVASALEAADGRDEDEDPLVDLVPELSGAIAGFAASHESRNEHYLLVDVGGLTLDCVFFRLAKDSIGDLRYSVFAADLRHYGSDIIRSWCAGNAPDRVPPALGNFLCDTIKSAQRKILTIPVKGGRDRVLQTFFIGGGRHSDLHRRAPVWAEESLSNWQAAPRLPLADLSPNHRDMAVPLLKGRNFGRLLVASGLARPRADIPLWKRSKDVPDAPLIMKQDWEKSFVGQEQT